MKTLRKPYTPANENLHWMLLGCIMLPFAIIACALIGALVLS